MICQRCGKKCHRFTYKNKTIKYQSTINALKIKIYVIFEQQQCICALRNRPINFVVLICLSHIFFPWKCYRLHNASFYCRNYLKIIFILNPSFLQRNGSCHKVKTIKCTQLERINATNIVGLLHSVQLSIIFATFMAIAFENGFSICQ